MILSTPCGPARIRRRRGGEIAAIQVQHVESHEHERVSGLCGGPETKAPFLVHCDNFPMSSSDSARSRPTSRVMAG